MCVCVCVCGMCTQTQAKGEHGLRAARGPTDERNDTALKFAASLAWPCIPFTALPPPHHHSSINQPFFGLVTCLIEVTTVQQE